MPQILDFDAFLHAPGPILDARSPGEYDQGHIPGAVSFPLFDNQERAQVGTCYKQVGRDAAVELGLELVGPKMAQFVRRARELAPEKQVRLHCWRGGMRSGSLAWLLETAGFQVTLLEGGYKRFRQWVRETLSRPRPIVIVGGMTGTGKTDVLRAIAGLGAQMLDLEGLAHHRGSSYGSLGLPPQPSTEHYENLLALEWFAFDPQRPVWIEAESRQVGRCRIPVELFAQMDQASVLQIERSRPERIALLLKDYGQADRTELIEATERIRKKLGGEKTREAVEAIAQGDLAPAIALVLDYYDKTYQYDLQRRTVARHSVDVSGLDALAAAQRLMAEAARRFPHADPTVQPAAETEPSPV